MLSKFNQIDPATPHPARIYDYFLGGRDWYPADQAAAERAEQVYPGIGHAARRNRAFLQRAGRYLAEIGVSQYVDIGTGIPTPLNLHDIVWEIDPAARFVYVDHDPTVLTHAAPFVKRSGGRAAFVAADIVQADVITDATVRHLDMTRPVAMSQVAVWHFVADEYQMPGDSTGAVYHPLEVMRKLLAPLPSGSYLALSHVTTDLAPDQAMALAQVYRDAGVPAQARTHDEIMRFFEGWELLSPGLVEVDAWHPDTEGSTDRSAPVPVYAGVARKP